MDDKNNNIIIAEMAKDIEYIKKSIDRFDKKYAYKWVEQGARGVIVMVFIALIGAVLNLILTK